MPRLILHRESLPLSPLCLPLYLASFSPISRLQILQWESLHPECPDTRRLLRFQQKQARARVKGQG